jgi:hypothetical protein
MAADEPNGDAALEFVLGRSGPGPARPPATFFSIIVLAKLTVGAAAAAPMRSALPR